MIHTAIHKSFVLEREYPYPPARVFDAFRDPARKARWFVGDDGFFVDSATYDFRVGGWERFRFRFGKDGPPMTNDTVYMEIVPDQRLVFAYSMTIGGAPLSVSLTTVEFVAKAGGTKTLLRFSEHDTFLDGNDGLASRREGTEGLLGKLAKDLEVYP
jgi:uncharacterized protein YndB with AHSA1/START domain